MTTAYVIIVGNGEYSNRCEWPYRVYLDKAKAQAAMTLLDDLSAKMMTAYNNIPRDGYQGESYWGKVSALKKATRAVYASAGFTNIYEEEYNFDFVDWRLEEAELIT